VFYCTALIEAAAHSYIWQVSNSEIASVERSTTNTIAGASTRKDEQIMLWMILVGLLVGVVAKFLMPGRDPGGAVVTILLGIGGSVVAGFLGRSIGWYADGEPAGFIASVLGAIVLLLAYRALRRRGGVPKAA
jgi:uncharacterized membrane protein YeaQ/YmgE (transglycosylase-associated protein family)